MAENYQEKKGQHEALGIAQVRMSLPFKRSEELLRLAREWEGKRVGAEEGSDHRTALNKGLIDIYRTLEKRVGDEGQLTVLPLPAGRGPFGIAADVLVLPTAGTVDSLTPFNRLDMWVAELEGFDSTQPQPKSPKLKQAPPRPHSRDRAIRAPLRMRQPGPILDYAGGAARGRGMARKNEFAGDAGTGFLDKLISDKANRPTDWSHQQHGESMKGGAAVVTRALTRIISAKTPAGAEGKKLTEARKVGVKLALEAAQTIPKEKMTSGTIRKDQLIRAIKANGSSSREWTKAIFGQRGGPVEEALHGAVTEVAKAFSQGLRNADSQVQRKGEEEKRKAPKEGEMNGTRHKALNDLIKAASQKLGPLLR